MTTSKEVLFHQPAFPAGAVNHYLEYALQFKQNSIRYEYAQYKSYKEFNTMLTEELMPLLLILCSVKKLFENSSMHVNADIDLVTNGDLRFVSNNSIYSVKHSMNNFILNPQELRLSKISRCIDNKSLLDLMQDVVHGFVASERQFGLGQPFISMHSEQILALNVFRQSLGVQTELA